MCIICEIKVNIRENLSILFCNNTLSCLFKSSKNNNKSVVVRYFHLLFVIKRNCYVLNHAFVTSDIKINNNLIISLFQKKNWFKILQKIKFFHSLILLIF